MKEHNIYKVPDLEKRKVSNLGCKISPENGMFCKTLIKQGLFD